MVLTTDFWINFEKEETFEFTEKIVRDDAIVRIQLAPQSHQIVSDSSYKGHDFNSFYDDIVELITKKVQKHAIKEPIGILWFVRSTDEPNNLPDLLLQKGFSKASSVYKLGIDLQSYESPASNKELNFDIEKVGEDKMFEEPVLNLLLKNFHLSNIEQVKMVQHMKNEMELKKGNKIENYIAYTKSNHEIVAHAGLTIRNEIAGLGELSGAVTDENYRQKGIYSALLVKRIGRCRELGLKYVIVNADQSTSGPILEKFGFKVIDRKDTFVLNFNKK